MVAGADQLVEIGAQVRFRHPLVRSAIYAGASWKTARRCIWPWHRRRTGQPTQTVAPGTAPAAKAPDEDVALELESSAGRAQARGGLAAAAALLGRSAALTGDPHERAERTLAAARANFQSGAFETSLGLLKTAQASGLDEFHGALADLLRGEIALASFLGGEAPPLLLKAAKRLEPLDVALAREAYLHSWEGAMFAGNFATTGTLREVSRAALTAPRPEGDPRLCDLALDAMALLVVEGWSASAPTLRGALAAVLNAAEPADEELRYGWLLAVLPCALWDFEAWEALNRRTTKLARDTGALAVLPMTLQSEGMQQTFAGEFASAASIIAQAEAIAEVTGTQIGPYAGLLLAGFESRGPEALTLITTTASAAAAGRQGTLLQEAQWLEALYYNGLGRYRDALLPAREASVTDPELYISTWALPELVEAAARQRGRPARRRCGATVRRGRSHLRYRLGAGGRRPLTCAGEYRPGR